MLTFDLLRCTPMIYCSMFYGQYDWMDMSGALHAQKLCKNAGEEAPNVKVYMVPNSVRKKCSCFGLLRLSTCVSNPIVFSYGARVTY